MTLKITINARKILVCFIAVISIAVLALAAFYVGQRTSKPVSQSDLDSKAVLSAATNVSEFEPLYFQGNKPPASLTLDQTSPNYSEGLFFYVLTALSGQKITIAQQKIPNELSASEFQGDENFDTTLGKATISNTPDGRMTGSLVTNDGILVLVNSQDIVDPSLFKSILSSLTPIKDN